MLANGHNHSDFVCPLLSDCSVLVCQNRMMGEMDLFKGAYTARAFFVYFTRWSSQGSIIILVHSEIVLYRTQDQYVGLHLLQC